MFLILKGLICFLKLRWNAFISDCTNCNIKLNFYPTSQVSSGVKELMREISLICVMYIIK